MPQTPDPNVPMFFTGDVCRAVGIDTSTLKNWIMRGVILMNDKDRERYGIEGPSHERVASGSGRSHLFTLRRVMQIALTAEMVRLGVPPGKAGMLALGFTDVGTGGAGYVGEDSLTIKRSPGQLYQSGKTLLVGYPEKDTSKIMNVHPKTPLQAIFSGVQHHGSAIIVDVNDVCEGVCAALDVVYPA